MSYYWSTKEDNILLEEVSKSPNNLSDAFFNASKRLKNRNYTACIGRWYNSLRFTTKTFSLTSNDVTIANSKNSASTNADDLSILSKLSKEALLVILEQVFQEYSAKQCKSIIDEAKSSDTLTIIGVIKELSE